MEINCFVMWQKVRASPRQHVQESEKSRRKAKGNVESSQYFLNKWFFNNLFLTEQLLVGLKIDALASYPPVCASYSTASEQQGRTGHRASVAVPYMQDTAICKCGLGGLILIACMGWPFCD